jgi:peptidoglycan/xylan/chitin deacetylase (PgdA/CDA1 family)
MARSIIRRVVRRVRRALPRRPEPVVLMYHRIAEESFDPWGLAVSPARFEAQVRWLRAHRKVLPLDRFAELHRSGQLPREAVAITFDDGYLCNRDQAAPVLDRHDAPATIFIATEAIHGQREFWWDELERLVLGFPGERLALDLPSGQVEIALDERQAGDRDWPPFAEARTPRQQAFYCAWEALRLLQPDEQEAALAALRDQAGRGAEPRASHRTMTPAEVRGLRSDRIAIGAHSLSHTSLSARSVEDQSHEIVESRSQVTEITGTAPTSFAYPYGDFDAHSLRLVAEAGFDCACTTAHQAVAKSASLFALPRVQVGNWSPDELARAIAAL